MEWAMSVFTSQPQSFVALWPVLISRPAEDRMLSWPGMKLSWNGLTDRHEIWYGDAY